MVSSDILLHASESLFSVPRAQPALASQQVPIRMNDSLAVLCVCEGGCARVLHLRLTAASDENKQDIILSACRIHGGAVAAHETKHTTRHTTRYFSSLWEPETERRQPRRRRGQQQRRKTSRTVRPQPPTEVHQPRLVPANRPARNHPAFPLKLPTCNARACERELGPRAQSPEGGAADGSEAGVCGGCGCIWTRRAASSSLT